MIGQSTQPIWKRAIIRAAIVTVILAAGVELLRMMGRAAELDRAEELILALGGGAVYGGLWALTAMTTANMLKKINDAAKGDKT